MADDQPMIRRRHALAAMAGGLGGMPALAAPGPLALRPVAAAESMAQIAAGGPTGLLAVSVRGALFALPLDGGAAQRLGDGLDPTTPVATGHGRIAARRRDGALWVLESGRQALSDERTLAPAAGLLVLPLAIIAIAAQGARHQVIRLEPSGPATWRGVARSEAAVLPDARPLQADLDGSGDGGHLVVLAAPDRERYAHGVLGDAIEATRVVLLERHSLRLMRELVLDAPHVFEDIAPRRVALGSRDGLLTVQSGPLGAQLALVDADPGASASLRVAARGPALGTAHRWLSPTTDGTHWLAVHTPHIGGVLHEYRRDGTQLLARRVHGDTSNHRIGSRTLDTAAWHGQRLLIPDRSGYRLLLLDGGSNWRPIGEQPVSSRVVATSSLSAPGQVAILHDDGAVTLGSMAG